jgi:WD40 repeat protein
MRGPASGHASAALRPGSTVKHYEVVRSLGRGGMGAVYLARDTKLGRLVALKVLLEAGAEQARRLAREARATARCRHENIVVIHDVDELDGRPYLVLEYLEGLTLHDWLERRDRQARPEGADEGEPVPAALAVELMKPVVRALACAHAMGIVHRDLKPANVMVTAAGPVKVLDFGIAERAGAPRPAGAGGEAGPGAPLGTLRYMAPEQWRGEAVDARTDLWAVGVMLHRLVTGAHPLGRCTLARLVTVGATDEPMPSVLARCPGLWPGLAAVIDRCLRKDPAERFGSAGELLKALDALEPGRPAAAPPAVEEGPFAGLSALQEGDAGRFFGREVEVEAALGRLRGQPLLAVAGPSGAGKSSFVRAGLVPAWKRAHETAEVIALRPGRRPLAALAEALGRAGEADRAPTGGAGAGGAIDADDLAASPGLCAARWRAHCRGRGPGHRLLVFVDQFEELYTLGAPPRERAAFVACLLGAADDPSSPLRVVLSVRGDFLDRAAGDRALAAELGRGLLLLPPIDARGLDAALRRPLEAAGYRFEDDALARAMVNDLAGARCPLPLLQFTAAALWRERDRARRVLTRASYERLGGVGGALSAHADATLAAMAPGERALCRAVLLRLVTPERTRAVVGAGELAPLGEGPGDVERVLGRLAEARLVLLGPAAEGDGAGGGPTVELVHESLVERWATLARWLDESAHDAQFEQRLRAAARQWHEGGEAEGLLWRDRAADEARRWAERRRGAPAGGAGEREERFVRAVLALAGRSRRRRRAALASLVGLLGAVAAVVSLLALRARREAGRAGREAERARAEVERADREAALARNATRLSVARELMPTDPTTSLGLLREVEPPALPRDWEALAHLSLYRGVSAALFEHPGQVFSAALDPAGRRVASACADGAVRVWPADGRGEPLVLRGHRGWVNAVAFSPDGRRIASASEDRTVRVWNADGSGEPVVLRGHEGSVTSVAFDPDGSGRLASAAKDRTVRVWPADGAGEPLVLRGHEGLVYSVAFSPDGSSRLASASADGTVRVWPPGGRGAPLVLRGHRDEVNDASFSPDGRLVVSASEDRTLRVWDARDPARAPLVYEAGAPVFSAAFGPDGRHLVSGDAARGLRVWGAGGAGELLSLAGHANVVYAARFAPDGARIVSASTDQTVRLWDVDLARSLTLRGPAGDVEVAAFSPDGRRVAAASADGTVRVWNADGSGPPVVLRGHERGVYWAAFAPDGARVASASADHTVRVWALDGPPRPPVVLRHEVNVLVVAFGPDGRRVATAADDGVVRIWPADGRGEPLALRGHRRRTTDVAFSPDGARVASGSVDKTVRLWPADGRGESTVLGEHDDTVLAVAFSPDGARVVSASQDRTVRVWSADGAAPPLVLRGHEEEVIAAAFSPDGARIVSAAKDQTVRVWSADGRGEPLVLRWGAGAELAGVAFGPRGDRLVTAWRDGAVRVRPLPARLGGPDAPALWAASTHCLPAARRVELLQTSADAARAQFDACRARIDAPP